MQHQGTGHIACTVAVDQTMPSDATPCRGVLDTLHAPVQVVLMRRTMAFTHCMRHCIDQTMYQMQHHVAVVLDTLPSSLQLKLMQRTMALTYCMPHRIDQTMHLMQHDGTGHRAVSVQ